MMKDFDIDKEKWEKVLHQLFEDEQIEYMIGTNHTNPKRIRLMVEHQHASKAHDIIIRSNK